VPIQLFNVLFYDHEIIEEDMILALEQYEKAIEGHRIVENDMGG
jgi:hypothetical protein